MDRYNTINKIENLIKTENIFFNDYILFNPNDQQRKHDHEIILATLSSVLYEIKNN